ncbi:hypothetical protein F4813DRAFT_353141 [Daldinia decipiens]|uniref:uncharacterized protein n=1 Tax=Daldinia decipiens TaxID=326647 RepID=UPI0020C2D32C|nr:uncharacterized protein F4813DRAFT_353141 [Daldinia decipiens]KAI1659493.1 hypothetical protein F4813DRAFT_353141 [Daldinia decipiens]
MRMLNRLIVREEPIPSQCYSTCNNALIEAQSAGKSPSLCSSNSVFMQCRTACEDCIEASGRNWTTAFSGEEGEWLYFCDTQTPSSTTPTEGSDWTSSRSIPYEIVTTTLPGTATIGGVTTTWSFQTAITLYSQIPATTAVEIPRTVNGRLTTFTFTTTYRQIIPNLELPTSIGNQTTSAIGISPPPTFGSEPATPASRAWIAGPVVGACSGVFILMLSAFLLWRRRQRKVKAQSKIELHGNSAVKTELEVPGYPQELDTTGSKTTCNEAGRPSEPQELPANG